MNSGQQQHDVSEAEYIAQENQYFKTAALGHGVLYFRAFNLILLPLLAMVFWPDITNRGVFLAVLCAALLINLGHFAAYFASAPGAHPWLFGVTIDSALIFALCHSSGGYSSGYKLLFFLFVFFSTIRFSGVTSFVATTLAIACVWILFLVDGGAFAGAVRDPMSFSLVLLGAALTSNGVASFVRIAHDKAVANMVKQVRASHEVVAQRNELQEQSERYRELLESVDAIPWEYDPQSQCFIYIGPQVDALLGHPQDTWLQTVGLFASSAHVEDHDKLMQLLTSTEAVNQAQEVELRLQHRDGDWRWVLLSTRLVQNNAGRILLKGLLFDITARKHNEQELARYQERLEEIVAERTQTLNSYAKQLEKLTTEDALTGIPNRRYFESEYEKEWRRAQRRQETIALMMIDVDSFKSYNDTYGHPAGDATLRTVAEVIQLQLRRVGDFVARYGGEEFVAVVPGADARIAALIAENICSAVAEQRLAHSEGLAEPYITVSIGAVSQVPAVGANAKAMISLADAALYQAKAQGRNRVVLHDGAPDLERAAGGAG
jgi:diguanylate cyclase (GGDEF)-like protein/PAS domain S-box-containing protein